MAYVRGGRVNIGEWVSDVFYYIYIEQNPKHNFLKNKFDKYGYKVYDRKIVKKSSKSHNGLNFNLIDIIP